MNANELRNLRYAVIEARWIGRPAERFALAYSSEESLRELIANASIVGTGFSSRQEAVALIPDSVTVALNVTRRLDAVRESEELTTRPDDEAAQLFNRIRSQQIWKMPRRLVHQLAAAFVLIVCSKNVFSVAVRAFIGF